MTTIRTACPTCGQVSSRDTYDIGSGPELSCASCECCWGAEGQPLQPIPARTIAAIVRGSRAAQGLPPTIEDQATLQRIADLMGADAAAWPHGHPCRDCGQLATHHPHPGCEGWR